MREIRQSIFITMAGLVIVFIFSVIMATLITEGYSAYLIVPVTLVFVIAIGMDIGGLMVRMIIKNSRMKK